MVANKRAGDVGSLRSARLLAPWTWGVAGRLCLSFGLLALLPIVGALMSYNYVLKVAQNLNQTVAIEIPLEWAVAEMEINAIETAKAVLDYVRDLDPEHLEKLYDSQADFKRFEAQYERLANTGYKRGLGQKIARHYAGVKALSGNIIVLADQRNTALQQFRRDVLAIDALIDDKLQKAIDRTALQAVRKIEAGLDMEINIHEAFSAIEGYIAKPDPALLRAVVDAEEDFKRFRAAYQETRLSTDEQRWLDQIDRNFADAVMAGSRILTTVDELNLRLEELEGQLKIIDVILDDEIQPLINAAAASAAQKAISSTEEMTLMLILLCGVGLIFGSAAAWALYRTIIKPIDTLVEGAEIIGNGDLEHKIIIECTGEFGILAIAFNKMVKEVSERTLEIVDKAKELEYALSREKELSEQQREFVSMASHEFRTPLAIIDGAAQRLNRKSNKGQLTPDDTNLRINKIRKAVGRMTRLMEATLSSARLEEGKIKVKIADCDIGNVVREVCEHQQEVADTHVITCHLASLPPTIQADAASLEQVLTNLLSNAVKYAPEAPNIMVKAWTEGQEVVLSVRDHGIGIDEEDLHKIGDRFFRAQTSAGIAGTGIGINLVKGLVEMHGGSMMVQSRKAEGSTFTIRVPVAGPKETKDQDSQAA